MSRNLQHLLLNFLPLLVLIFPSRLFYFDNFAKIRSDRFFSINIIVLILIDDILISTEITQRHFACHLQSCHGACCYEGDYGAPLEEKELDIIEECLPRIKPFMEEAAISKIEESGFYTEGSESGSRYETALMPDAACVFMGRDQLGITFCAIERAHYKGDITFKKPISCHLYPVRVTSNDETGFEALNYDQWDICNPACSNGKSAGIKVYEFVKDALIRKYGEGFYNQLSAAAEELESD